MDYKFFSLVRLPRDVADDLDSPKATFIFRCAEQIANLAQLYGDKVFVLDTPYNGNRLVVCGNERNAQVAAALIDLIVSDISKDTYDRFESYAFAEKKFEEIMGAPYMKAESQPQPSCEVDLKVSPHDMNRRQFNTYNKLRSLFDTLEVSTSSVMHEDGDTKEKKATTSIKLSCEDADTLKVIKLTAEWAAAVIEESTSISRRDLQDMFSKKSLQTLGRQTGKKMIHLAYG